MPRVELEPGEQVTVTFKDSDGEITVEFREDALLVTADMPDTSGRGGVIYEECFNPNACQRDKRCLRADGHPGACKGEGEGFDTEGTPAARMEQENAAVEAFQRDAFPGSFVGKVRITSKPAAEFDPTLEPEREVCGQFKPVEEVCVRPEGHSGAHVDAGGNAWMERPVNYSQDPEVIAAMNRAHLGT